MARHQAAAIRLAAFIAGPSDADDVAQDAFVKAYRALGRFRDGAAFRPWLLRIVANEARNRRRFAGRQARLALRLVDVPVGDPTPEDAVVAAERREALLAALNGLSERDRMVLGCRFLVGLSEAETAVALDCAAGTVKSRTSRALDRLRARLDPSTREAVVDG